MDFPLIYHAQAIFGLDIGQHTAKFLQLSRSNNRLKLIGLGAVIFPSGTIIDGVIAEPEELAKVLGDALNSAPIGHITAHAVAASLPQAHLFTRILTLPAMEEAKLSEAVQWEAQQYIPLPMNDLYIDFDIVSTRKDEQGVPLDHDILLVASPRAIVDSYMKLFEFLRLTPHSLETSLAANVRALRPHQRKMNVVLIIDAGSTSADMAIVTDTIRVTTTVAFGGDSITELISKRLKVTLEEADEIKRRLGVGPSNLQTKVETALGTTLKTLLTEIQKLVKYFEERSGSQDGKKHPVERILLVGGMSRMPGFAQYLAANTKLPVDISSPWDHQPVRMAKPLPHALATTYTTAFGLALGDEGDLQ